MPKKKNFLGGQQNYNPNNGQYEPALKGPNGESPSQFSSFKKEKDESFDAINKKRMGKSWTDKFKSPKTGDITFDPNDDHYKTKSPEITNTDAYLTAPIVSALEKAEGRSLENDELRKIVKDMAEKNPNATPEEFEKMLLNYKGGSNNKNAEVFNDYKEEYTQAYKEGGEKGLKDAVLKSGYTTEQYKYALEQLKGGSSRDDEDALKMLKWGGNFTDDEWEKVKANENWVKGYLEGKYTPKEIKAALKIDAEMKPEFDKAREENNSFDQINAKRMGKEQPKSEEPNTNSMSIKEFSAYAKKMLKDKGFDTKGISVRGRYAGYSDALDVVVKDPNIDVAKIRKLLQKHESYERDASGEILQGGNRYIHVQYDYNAFDKVKEEGKADAENLMKQADTSRGNGIELVKGVYLFKDDGRYFINGDYEKVGGSRTVYSPEDLAVMKWKLKKFGRLN